MCACPLRSIEERDALVVAHLELVRKIAGKLSRKFPPSIELDDLVSDGMLGLMHAATTFRVVQKIGYTKPVPFGAFAARKIWSAIMDANRRRHFRNATHQPLEEITEPSAPAGFDQEIDFRRRASALHVEIARLPNAQHGQVIAFCRRNGQGHLAGEARVALRNGLALQGLRRAA